MKTTASCTHTHTHTCHKRYTPQKINTHTHMPQKIHTTKDKHTHTTKDKNTHTHTTKDKTHTHTQQKIKHTHTQTIKHRATLPGIKIPQESAGLHVEIKEVRVAVGGVALQLPAQKKVGLLQNVQVGGGARLLDTTGKVHLQPPSQFSPL